jgi:hypothetical protein
MENTAPNIQIEVPAGATLVGYIGPNLSLEAFHDGLICVKHEESGGYHLYKEPLIKK